MRALGVLCLMIYEEILALFSRSSTSAQIVYLVLVGLVTGWMAYCISPGYALRPSYILHNDPNASPKILNIIQYASLKCSFRINSAVCQNRQAEDSVVAAVLAEVAPTLENINEASIMDDLPQELIALIASFLERRVDYPEEDFPPPKPAASKLPPYAAISRKWQLAIEFRTFNSVHLRSSKLYHRARTLTGHRWAFISALSFDVVLPEYDDHRCAKFETQEEMEANNQAFTNAMQALFHLLKSWEPESTHEQSRSIALAISAICSPMDKWRRPAKKAEEDDWNWGIGKRADLWEHRYEHSLIRLVEHVNLPSVAIISSLDIESDSRRLEPRSAALLATKFPQAHTVQFDLFDNQSKHPNNNKSARYDFATAVCKLCRPSLREFQLKYYLHDPSNHYFSPPNILLPSESSVDHLSLALHTLSLSQNLTYLSLDPVCISPSIYWPSGLANPPSWPNLRHHFVEFQMTTPDGRWYFVRDPSAPIDDDEGEDDSSDPDAPPSTDSDSVPDTNSEASKIPDTYRERREAVANGEYPVRKFRTLPDETLINPLLMAMARAAGQMPKLQTMALISTMRDRRRKVFCVSYVAKEVESPTEWDPGDVETPRMDWSVGSWRPKDVILDVWRKEKGVSKIEFVEWCYSRGNVWMLGVLPKENEEHTIESIE
ncbi:MAG: hypothetical protein Q9204_001250 [Flavoplaca sp. TL-2023a]